MDPAYKFEKKTLNKFLEVMQRQEHDFELEKCLNVCELSQNWQYALYMLKWYGKLNFFIQVLTSANQQ